MELENKEVVEVQQTPEVEKSCKYLAHIKYDKDVLKTFAKFYNSVKHPRATIYMFCIGLMLFALPFVNHDIKLPGQIVCYVMGPILFLMSLFRHNISVMMMKDTPDMKIGQNLYYRFTNTGVQLDKNEKTDYLGNYKKIYRLWEDEETFYIGMNEDDLLVLPKDKFEEGDVSTFRDFILDKSRCIFTWKPKKINNIIRWKIIQLRTKNQQEETEKGK